MCIRDSTTAVPSLSDNSIPQTNGNSNTPAAQNGPIRPIIQPAQGVSPDSSVGAAAANFDPYTRMANEYGTIAQGEAPRAREVDVPQSTDGSDRVRRFARTALEAVSYTHLTGDVLAANADKNKVVFVWSSNSLESSATVINGTAETTIKNAEYASGIHRCY